MKIELGAKVKDRIAGFTGIAAGRIEYITGCVRWEVEPSERKSDGELLPGYAFPEERLEVVKKAGALKADLVEFKIALGSKVRETITGFAGTATARCQDLWGNIKIRITSDRLHDGKPIDDQWFDDQTIEVIQAGHPYRSPASVGVVGGPATRKYQAR